MYDNIRSICRKSEKKPCDRQPFHENRKGYLNLKTMNEKTFKLEFNNKKENLRK